MSFYDLNHPNSHPVAPISSARCDQTQTTAMTDNSNKTDDDPLTISEVGNITIRVHAAEALLARAARLFDAADSERGPTASERRDLNISLWEKKFVLTPST
jgi:hypothetical protein